MLPHPTINTGINPNDGLGDGLRTNMRKLIANDVYLNAAVDQVNNTLLTGYYNRDQVDDNIIMAVDSAVALLLNNPDAGINSIQELLDQVNNADATLLTAISEKVSYTTSQTLTSAEKLIAQTNIGLQNAALTNVDNQFSVLQTFRGNVIIDGQSLQQSNLTVKGVSNFHSGALSNYVGSFDSNFSSTFIAFKNNDGQNVSTFGLNTSSIFEFDKNVMAPAFIGDGSQLTNITNAALPDNVAYTDVDNNFSVFNTFLAGIGIANDQVSYFGGGGGALRISGNGTNAYIRHSGDNLFIGDDQNTGKPFIKIENSEERINIYGETNLYLGLNNFSINSDDGNFGGFVSTDTYVLLNFTDQLGSGNFSWSGFDNQFSFNRALKITSNDNLLSGITITNTNSGTGAGATLKLVSDGGTGYVYKTSNAFGLGLADRLGIQNAEGILFVTGSTLVRYEINSSGNHDFKDGTATFGGQINSSNSTVLNSTGATGYFLSQSGGIIAGYSGTYFGYGEEHIRVYTNSSISLGLNTNVTGALYVNSGATNNALTLESTDSDTNISFIDTSGTGTLNFNGTNGYSFDHSITINLPTTRQFHTIGDSDAPIRIESSDPTTGIQYKDSVSSAYQYWNNVTGFDLTDKVKAIGTLELADDGASGYTHSRVILNSSGNARGAGTFSRGQTHDWFWGNPYLGHDTTFVIARAVAGTSDALAQISNALFSVKTTGIEAINSFKLKHASNTWFTEIIEDNDATKSAVRFKTNDGTNDVNTQLFIHNGSEYKRLATEDFVNNAFSDVNTTFELAGNTYTVTNGVITDVSATP